MPRALWFPDATTTPWPPCGCVTDVAPRRGRHPRGRSSAPVGAHRITVDGELRSSIRPRTSASRSCSTPATSNPGSVEAVIEVAAPRRVRGRRRCAGDRRRVLRTVRAAALPVPSARSHGRRGARRARSRRPRHPTSRSSSSAPTPRPSPRAGTARTSRSRDARTSSCAASSRRTPAPSSSSTPARPCCCRGSTRCPPCCGGGCPGRRRADRSPPCSPARSSRAAACRGPCPRARPTCPCRTASPSTASSTTPRASTSGTAAGTGSAARPPASSASGSGYADVGVPVARARRRGIRMPATAPRTPGPSADEPSSSPRHRRQRRRARRPRGRAGLPLGRRRRRAPRALARRLRRRRRRRRASTVTVDRAASPAARSRPGRRMPPAGPLPAGTYGCTSADLTRPPPRRPRTRSRAEHPQEPHTNPHTRMQGGTGNAKEHPRRRRPSWSPPAWLSRRCSAGGGGGGDASGKVLTVGMPNGPQQPNQNPLATGSASLSLGYAYAVYESLMQVNEINPTDDPTPVARRVGRVERRLHAGDVITARDGVKWSDGEDFTADDIAFSIQLRKDNPELNIDFPDQYGDITRRRQPGHGRLHHRPVRQPGQALQAPHRARAPLGRPGPGDLDRRRHDRHRPVHAQVVHAAGRDRSCRTRDYWGGKPAGRQLRYDAFNDNAGLTTALTTGEAQWGWTFIPDYETTFIAKDPDHYHQVARRRLRRRRAVPQQRDEAVRQRRRSARR